MIATATLAPIRKRILLKCSATLSTSFSVPACHFESFGGQQYLKLVPKIGSYTAVTNEEVKGDYLYSIVGVAAPTVITAAGFQVEVDHKNIEILNLVEAIALNCQSADGATHTPLQVIDFVKPDGQRRFQTATIPPEFYTVRSGRITQLTPKESGVGIANPLDPTKSLHYGGGFTFRFMEATQRRVL